METILRDLKAKARRRHRALGGQRREHLATLAKELGLDGWPDVVAVLRDAEPRSFGTLLYAPACVSHFNVWCADEEEARRIRDEHGGWLLPYRNQFVVVDRHFLETLGLDPDDDGWDAMGRDWIRPRSLPARQRFCQRLVTARAATLS